MAYEDIPVIPPYNPLDKKSLATNVKNVMLNTELQQLPPKPFIGAGVYAIYYFGDYPAYKYISKYNKQADLKIPIYVGKAVPAGARKGGFDLNIEHGLALFNRLSEHAISIMKASNLRIEDFRCRFLVVDDIWIPLAESLMIEEFKPLWNRCVDGFGNHDPGKGRYMQKRSQWDTIHEGREWAFRLNANTLSSEEILKRIEDYILMTYSF